MAVKDAVRAGAFELRPVNIALELKRIAERKGGKR